MVWSFPIGTSRGTVVPAHLVFQLVLLGKTAAPYAPGGMPAARGGVRFTFLPFLFVVAPAGPAVSLGVADRLLDFIARLVCPTTFSKAGVVRLPPVVRDMPPRNAMIVRFDNLPVQRRAEHALHRPRSAMSYPDPTPSPAGA